jgi:hypothetical protein
VANNSDVWPAVVDYYGETDENFTGYGLILPHGRWKLDEASGTSFAADNGSAAACGNSCPTVGVSGYRGNAVQLGDGQQIRFSLGSDASSFSKAFAVGGWVYPTGGGANAVQRVFALQSANSNDGATLLDSIYYNRNTQQFWTTHTVANGSGSAALNQWHHVMLVYDRFSGTQFFYVDGALAAKQVLQTASNYDPHGRTLVAGDQITVNDINSNSVVGFLGKLDDVTVYSYQVLSAADVQQIMADQTLRHFVAPSVQTFNVPALSQRTLTNNFWIPATTLNGALGYTQIAEAALDAGEATGISSPPLVRAHFDEEGGRAYSGFGPNYYQSYSCVAATCPSYVSDFAGQALQLDGYDDFMQIAAPISTGSWTIGVWFYPTFTHNSLTALFGKRTTATVSGATQTTGGFPSLYLTREKKLALAIYTSGGWKEYTPVNPATVTFVRWHQATLTFDGSSTYTIYLDGQLYGTVTASAAAMSSPLYLGAIGSGYKEFKGRLDNFTVYNTKLSASQVEALSSMPDLSLHGHYTFDDLLGASSFIDVAGVFGSATCMPASACPRPGVTGESNRAIYFDGADKISTANNPAYWQAQSSDYTVAVWVKARWGAILEASG